jgi:hypothetical protein
MQKTGSGVKAYLDYDSVMVDMGDWWLRVLNEEHGTNYTTQDLTHWDRIAELFPNAYDYLKPGMYTDVLPIKDSQWFVDTLKLKYGEENVIIVSHTVFGCEEEKHEHAKYFFDIKEENIIHARNKWQFTSDGFLVDDHKGNIIPHVLNNPQIGFLFNHYGRYGWNQLDESERHPAIIEAQTYGHILLNLPE